MSTAGDLVTIILPIYNVEPYLLRAVNSVRMQTHQNLEIILVDDGSKDSSGILCDCMAQKDIRIRVIHQKNRGVSAARNVGLSAATGEYVFFLDPDDTIQPETIHIMRMTMEEKCCDLVICGVRKIFLDEMKKPLQEVLLNLGSDGFYSNIDIIMRLRSTDTNEVDYCGSACNRMYRREILMSQREPFPVGLDYCEDVYFSIDLLSKCKKIYCMIEPFYNYFRYHKMLRKTSMNNHVEKRFEIYKTLHLKICKALCGKVGNAELARCKHNFIDRVILACVDLCKSESSYTEEEIAKRLTAIVNDKSVINALPYYDCKALYNWSNSWTIPFLIQKKEVEYLMYFARKVAKVKCV